MASRKISPTETSLGWACDFLEPPLKSLTLALEVTGDYSSEDNCYPGLSDNNLLDELGMQERLTEAETDPRRV